MSEQTCATALITRSNPAKNISPPVYFDLSIHVYYVEKRRKWSPGIKLSIRIFRVHEEKEGRYTNRHFNGNCIDARRFFHGGENENYRQGNLIEDRRFRHSHYFQPKTPVVAGVRFLPFIFCMLT